MAEQVDYKTRIGKAKETGREWPVHNIAGRAYNRTDAIVHQLDADHFVVLPARMDAVAHEHLEAIRLYVKNTPHTQPVSKTKARDDETK